MDPQARLTPLDLYFLLHTGNPGDVEFYTQRARHARAVMEVGCGDGRILRHLLSPDREVVGIDVEEAFVRRARQLEAPDAARFRVEQADVRTAQFPRARFDCILIPYNTVYALGGAEGVQACARNCFHAAAVGAVLWLDVYPVDEFHEMALRELPPEDDDEPLLELEGSGGRYSVTETTQLDPPRQHLEATYRATSETKLRVELTLHHDYLLLRELVHAFEAEGWKLLEQREGFSEGGPEPGTRDSCSEEEDGRTDGDSASRGDVESALLDDAEEAEAGQIILGFCKRETSHPV